jgi:hypothetical protein
VGALLGRIDFFPSALGILFISLAVPFWHPIRRSKPRIQWRRWVSAGALIILLVMIASCSAGGDGNPSDDGTPAGTYQISIQGQSGNVTASATVTLVVN